MAVEIRPQPGPQTAFLSTPADIAIIGGGNDGGKTFALLMDASRHSANTNFGAVFFRRETPQITHTGGLWEEARKMYGGVSTLVTSPRHQLTFPSGATLAFSHMQLESDRFNWDGAQIPAIYFDQLEQFTDKQFWHMVGRNRSDCGVRPYIRGSFNPDPDSWLPKFIEWYWDQDTGYLIPERSGVVRWFVRSEEGAIEWFGSKPDDPNAKSFTCILALIDDNKIALARNPERLANLMSLPRVERERRRFGNMKIRDLAGNGLIKAEWWIGKYIEQDVWHEILKDPLRDWKWKRSWDLAGGDSKGADYTVGVLIGKHKSDENRRVIADLQRGKWTPLLRNETIKNTIIADARFEAQSFIWRPTMNTDMHRSVMNAIAGLPYQFVAERGSKLFRAQSWSPQVEAGSYYMVRAEWNEAVIHEGAEFTGEPSTEIRKDDIIDAICLGDMQHTLWG